MLLSCIWLLRPHGLKPTRLLCPWDFPGKNMGVGCHFLLQGIFLTQGLNPHVLYLMHWQTDSLLLEQFGKPYRLINIQFFLKRSFCSSNNKESACNAEDLGSIPGSGRSPGDENGNPLQYSCLEKSHGQRSLVGYSPWGHKESDTTERLFWKRDILSEWDCLFYIGQIGHTYLYTYSYEIYTWVWSTDINVHIYFPPSVFPTPHACSCRACHSITISAYVLCS